MLFVAAEAREFAGLLPLCESVEKLRWPVSWARSAKLGGRAVFLAANGAGPKLAGQAVDFARWELGDAGMEAVVSTGFCGGLAPSLKIGDVFVANGIQMGGSLVPIRTPASGRPFATGTLVSRDRVAQTTEEKRDLYREGASAVDMEAAGVLVRVREWDKPFYCVRSVTDLANESFQVDFNAARGADGRFRTSKILAAALRRPISLGPELFELRGRCVTAAKTLGEFLADCSFC